MPGAAARRLAARAGKRARRRDPVQELDDGYRVFVAVTDVGQPRRADHVSGPHRRRSACCTRRVKRCDDSAGPESEIAAVACGFGVLARQRRGGVGQVVRRAAHGAGDGAVGRGGRRRARALRRRPRRQAVGGRVATSARRSARRSIWRGRLDRVQPRARRGAARPARIPRVGPFPDGAGSRPAGPMAPQAQRRRKSASLPRPLRALPRPSPRTSGVASRRRGRWWTRCSAASDVDSGAHGAPAAGRSRPTRSTSTSAPTPRSCARRATSTCAPSRRRTPSARRPCTRGRSRPSPT